MPFESEKQRKYMWVHHPEIAEQWSKEAKESNQPLVRKGDDDDGFEARLQEIRSQHVPFEHLDKLED
jgi:hypothetical protein